MKEEKFSIYKNGKFEEIILKTPDEVKTNHYEIGYAWMPTPIGGLPESEADFHLEAAVVLNMASRRLKNDKDALMAEIQQKLKDDGWKGMSMIHLKDFWDDNGLRPKQEPTTHYCSECGHELEAKIIK